MPHRGIELASATSRSDALPTELHPHPPTSTLRVRLPIQKNTDSGHLKVQAPPFCKTTDLSSGYRQLRPLRQANETTPREFKLAVRSARTQRALPLFSKTTRPRAWFTMRLLSREACSYAGADWLSPICQSEGGEKLSLHGTKEQPRESLRTRKDTVRKCACKPAYTKER